LSQDWNVINATETDHDIKLDVVLNVPPVGCPRCGGANLVRFGRIDQVFMDLPVHGKRVGLHIQRQRYRCGGCSRTFVQPISALDDKRVMTKRLVSYVERESVKRTFVSIADDTGLNEHTVRNVFRDYVARLEKDHVFVTPEWLGIDELTLVGKPRCILTNVKERTAIDLLETRTKAVVQARLMRLTDRHKITVVAMDMWAPYREAAAAALPKAQIVIDKFHIQRMANGCLDAIRKSLRESLSAAARRTLMRDRYVLLRRRRDLDEKDLLILETWTNHFPQLATAYEMKEAFFDIWQVESERDARKLYRAWLGSCPSDLLWAFQPIVTAMANWEREIFAYFSHHRVTNAYTEALNGVVKVANRTGRGYSFEAIRARLLFGEGLHKRNRPGYEKRTRDAPALEQMRQRLDIGIDLNVDLRNYGTDLSTLAQQLEDGVFE
jgi:transposase